MAIHLLTVIKIGNGTGTVTSNAGVPANVVTPINCGITCSSSVAATTTITFTATPDPGSVFVGWTGAFVSSSNPFSYESVGDSEVIAEFKKKTRKKRVGGVIGRQEYIYLNDQQMEDLIRLNPSFSNGIVIQRNLIGLGSVSTSSISMPPTITYGGNNYTFSGIVDTRNILQNVQDPSYVWRRGLVFYRYTLSRNTASNL